MAVSAKVRWTDGKRQFVGETGSGHGIVLDAGPENGGRDTGMRPMELLLLGQAGCTGMDVVVVLEKMRKRVTGLEVAVEGERRAEHPRWFETIQVVYTVRGEGLKEKDVVKAIRLSETTYCSASAILEKTAKIGSRYKIIDEASGDLVASGEIEAHES
jgi:putative redox protein